MHLGLIGYGNIAQTLIALLAEHGPRLTHLTLLTRPNRVDAAADALRAGPRPADRLDAVGEIAALVDARPELIVECAGHGAVRDGVLPALRAGIDTVVVSIGALSDASLETGLRDAAAEGGARLILPAGAIGGIDLLAALAPAGGLAVVYTGTKPPAAWRGSPAEAALDLDALRSAAVLFEGDAREAAARYPKNANVAATLALAGPGFAATRVRLVADPAATGNVHAYRVTSPVAEFEVRIENRPSGGNARTSLATIHSVLRAIRNRVGPVMI